MQYVFDREVVLDAVDTLDINTVGICESDFISRVDMITINIEHNNLYKYSYKTFIKSIHNNGLGSFLFITYNKSFVLPERTSYLIDDCFMILSGLLEEENKDIKNMFDEFCDKYLYTFRYSKADSWKEFISYGVNGMIAMASENKEDHNLIIEKLKSTTATQIILTDDEVELLGL